MKALNPASVKGAGGAVRKINRVKSPSKRMLLIDVDRILSWPSAFATNKNDLNSLVLGGTGYRHRGRAGANVGFADGHVENMIQTEIPQDKGTAAAPNYFWAGPEEGMW